ncbi:MAG TPA: DUF3224 domain-containing protein [Verrucomicrobiae bacterium]|nr:DUF3224 domain-containing protein [Verrucomicrobiae bacterium]
MKQILAATIVLAPPIIAATVVAAATLAAGVHAQVPSPKEALVMHATGPFDVKVTPAEEKSDDPLLGRMMLDKQYHGDLEGTGKGQMLTAGSPAKGAGGYVAIEKVTGTLHGRAGSFVLQHSGTMANHQPQMTITIVPESGTGQLEGIAGTMTITVAPTGKHTYDLEYTLRSHL